MILPPSPTGLSVRGSDRGRFRVMPRRRGTFGVRRGPILSRQETIKSVRRTTVAVGVKPVAAMLTHASTPVGAERTAKASKETARAPRGAESSCRALAPCRAQILAMKGGAFRLEGSGTTPNRRRKLPRQAGSSQAVSFLR